MATLLVLSLILNSYLDALGLSSDESNKRKKEILTLLGIKEELPNIISYNLVLRIGLWDYIFSELLKFECVACQDYSPPCGPEFRLMTHVFNTIRVNVVAGPEELDEKGSQVIVQHGNYWWMMFNAPPLFTLVPVSAISIPLTTKQPHIDTALPLSLPKEYINFLCPTTRSLHFNEESVMTSTSEDIPPTTVYGTRTHNHQQVGEQDQEVEVNQPIIHKEQFIQTDQCISGQYSEGDFNMVAGSELMSKVTTLVSEVTKLGNMYTTNKPTPEELERRKCFQELPFRLNPPNKHYRRKGKYKCALVYASRIRDIASEITKSMST